LNISTFLEEPDLSKASNEIVFMTDIEGIITYINPQFSKVYGSSAEEV